MFRKGFLLREEVPEGEEKTRLTPIQEAGLLVWLGRGAASGIGRKEHFCTDCDCFWTRPILGNSPMPQQGNASSVTRIVSLFCTRCVSIRAQEPLITGFWVLLFWVLGFFCDILVCCFTTPGMKHTKTKVFWSKAIVHGACFHCQCCVISSRFLPQDKCS